MVAQRVADRRLLRLLRQWLRAGVMEGQEWRETLEGTPQRAGISPLLANIFLHYALDRWVQQWRRQRARGRVIIVRYADDFVMGFQYEADAQAMLAALAERLAQFRRALHRDKTRLLEFGKLVAERRRGRKVGVPGGEAQEQPTFVEGRVAWISGQRAWWSPRSVPSSPRRHFGDQHRSLTGRSERIRGSVAGRPVGDHRYRVERTGSRHCHIDPAADVGTVSRNRRV